MGKQARRDNREMRKAKAAIAQQRASRHRLLTYAGIVVIIGLLAAIVFTFVKVAGQDQNNASGPLVAPTGATAAGALTVGRANAPAKVEIYLDYMCPFCGRFEAANGADIERLVADGSARLELYPMSFLDKTSSGTRYSTRAANAAATVADRAPERLLAFHRALFDRQPKEGSRGLPNAEIAAIARGAGVPQEVIDAFGKQIFEPWVAKSTQAVFDSGVEATPTVKINGELFTGDQLYQPGPLAAAITAARTK